MSTINSIVPNKSLRSGGTSFVINGTNLITTNLSNDFSGGSFYSDISSGGGIILDTNKLILSVNNIAGCVAGISPLHTFLLAFDIAILLEEQGSTLPAVDKAVIIAVKARDSIDPTTYYEIQLRYDSFTGYSIKNTAVVSGSTEYVKSRSIDAHQVQGLKVIRSGNRFSGYIKISDTFVEMGSYQGFGDFDSAVDIYCANSPTGVANDFSIGVTDYILSTVVSLANKPATITSISNTKISGYTQPQSIQTDDLIVGFPDLTTVTIASGFSYVESSNIKNIGRLFDVALSIYNYQVNPERSELFFSSKGFTWDKDYWADPDNQNNNLYIPSLWDPTTGGIPSEMLQSGYGDYDNIELVDVVKQQTMDNETWHPRLKHGTYFIQNVPYYLYSDESLVKNLGEDQTPDGRSKANLLYPLKMGIPISASTLQVDKVSGLTIDLDRYRKVVKFSGKIQNGIELDTDILENIDTENKEFIVKYNPNNICKNYKIPVVEPTIGTYSFTLPKVPLADFPIIFSRKDIFKVINVAGSVYGQGVYNEFYYSGGLNNPGDYSVNYITGEVRVILDYNYIDLGYVSFTFEYPAVLEFNNNYVEDKGSQIVDPVSSDLNILTEVGESSGEEEQRFVLKEFPILDKGTDAYIDNDNFKLFVYNSANNIFDTGWTRVKDLDGYGVADKVYTLNSATGEILFGDGIHGAIPEKYRLILVGYKNSVRIEYEPIHSTNYWIGKNTDFNFNKSNLNSGFIYISRKNLIPSNISLAFSTDEITALEFADLTATVTDIDGEPISGLELQFEIIGGISNVSEEIVVTDFKGIARTTFIPSGDVKDLGIFSHLYEEGPNEFAVGDSTEAILTTGAIENNTLILQEELAGDTSDIYLFKIYDNDDSFAQYNPQNRTGGTYIVYYEYNISTLQNELIRPIEVNSNILIFGRSLPQSYNPSKPNYEPNLRGYVVVGRKRVQARASVNLKRTILQSNVASIRVGFSPIQKGEWTLPILPTTYTSSEISSATYITINP